MSPAPRREGAEARASPAQGAERGQCVCRGTRQRKVRRECARREAYNLGTMREECTHGGRRQRRVTAGGCAY
eukprot:88409-Chlamydomonas_euryale.AAC.1